MTESPCLPSPFAALRLAPLPDWPAERQRALLHALLHTGSLPAAAASVGASAHAVTALRRRLGRRSAFARAWRHAIEEAKADAAATRFLRKRGLDPAQHARVDAACHGSDKVRLAIGLALHALRAAEGRTGD